jgi:hypothetical protein
MAAMMNQLLDLENQLAALQSTGQPQATLPVDPTKPDPAQPTVSAPTDPAQAALMAQIIALKNAMTGTNSPTEMAALMNQLLDLENQLAALPSAPNASSNSVPPGNSVVGELANNKLSSVSTRNRVIRASFQKSTVTISWEGGSGVVLQTSRPFGAAGWQDVPGTEGKSSIELPTPEGSAFWRVIKR